MVAQRGWLRSAPALSRHQRLPPTASCAVVAPVVVGVVDSLGGDLRSAVRHDLRGREVLPECGAQFAAGPHADRRERRVVSVCSPIWSGLRAAVRAWMWRMWRVSGRYHELLRRELERMVGWWRSSSATRVMALFGAPVAYEDDPERAVRSALSIQCGGRMRERDGGSARSGWGDDGRGIGRAGGRSAGG